MIRSLVYGFLLISPFRRGGGSVVMDHLPLAVDAKEQIGRLHPCRVLVFVAAERDDQLDAGHPGQLALDGDTHVATGDGPGARVREDVVEGATDLAPTVEPVPAGMDAARGLRVSPDHVHGREVAGLQRAVEAQVRGRDRRIFRVAHAKTEAIRSGSTFPPETIATTRAPSRGFVLPARRAATAAAPEPST